MNKKTYNLIYACYWILFGPDDEYEHANQEEYEEFAIGMLENIQEELQKRDK